MTRIVTLDPEAAALSDGALTLIKAIKTFENEVLPKAAAATKERHDLEGVADRTKMCRHKLEALREALMLAAAGDGEPDPTRRTRRKPG
jgi:hypothetical protein